MMLRETATVNSAVEALRIVSTLVPNAYNKEHLEAPRDAYLRHVNAFEGQLGNVFDRASVLSLLHTQRYWFIAANPTPATLPADQLPMLQSVNAAVNQEISALTDRLEAAAEQFRILAAWLDRPGLLTILDTNVLMHCQPIDKIDWRVELKEAGVSSGEAPRLIVPLAVVDELDRKKFEGAPKQQDRAKAAIKSLYGLRKGCGPDEAAKVTATGGSEVTLEIPRDDIGRTRLAVTDDELIAFGAFLRQAGNRNVALVTRDLGAEIRAGRCGLKVAWLSDKYGKDMPSA